MKSRADLINLGYKFDPSNYLSEGWKLLSKNMGPLIGMTLLYFVISITFSTIPVLGMLSNILSPILFAGFYIYLTKYRSAKHDAKDFFGGFKFSLEIILQQLVFVLLFIPFVFVVFALGFPIEELVQLVLQEVTPEEFGEAVQEKVLANGVMIFLAVVIFIIASLYLYVSYMFAIPLIVVGKYKFWDAMETSRQVVSKYFFGFFFSLLVFGLLSMIIMAVTCGLGALLVIPLGYSAVYAAFESIFEPTNLEGKSDLDEFGTSPGEYNSERDYRP